MASNAQTQQLNVLKWLNRLAKRRNDRNISYANIELAFRQVTDLREESKILGHVQDMLQLGYLIACPNPADPIGAILSQRQFQIGEEGLILMQENQEKIA